MISRSSLSDEELVDLAKHGDRDAFACIYRRYFNVVYNRVRYLVPDADVEDVTQEIFIALLRSIKGFQARSLFRTWFRTLTTRQIAEYYRKKGRHNNFQITLDEIENLPDRQNSYESLEVPFFVRTALNELPEQYREIILLRFADGFSFNEISTLIKRHPEATKSLFRRAISALTQKLEDEDVREIG